MAEKIKAIACFILLWAALFAVFAFFFHFIDSEQAAWKEQQEVFK